jgi:ferric-dicitrate binding protein FerR (iron transport regulator)
MTEHDLPDDLLGRFLSGEATAADRVAVETWAAASPENRIVLDQLLEATAPPTQGAWDVARAWQQTVKVIRRPEGSIIAINRPARHRVLLRLAAAVVVVLGVVFAWRQLNPPPADTVYATAHGERLDVRLPDGTAVVLGSFSSLTVPPDFAVASRRVTLDGEAWFEASHDSMAFEVASGDYLVRDIGTEFTVTRRDDLPLEVVVLAGEVQVRVRADTTVLLASLAAGDVGQFAQPDSLLEHEAVLAHDQPVAMRAAWRTGTLDVIDAPVRDVIARLASWHGMSIEAAPGLSEGRTITVTLPLDSLDAAIDVLANLLGAEAVRGPGIVRLQ